MLRTEWTEAWEREDSPGTLPMPLQFMLINDAMRRINKFNVKELTTMPVGQIVGRMNDIRPVKEVMQRLVEEYLEAVDRLQQLTPQV